MFTGGKLCEDPDKTTVEYADEDRYFALVMNPNIQVLEIHEHDDNVFYIRHKQVKSTLHSNK